MNRLLHNLKLLGIAVVLSICSAYIIRNPEFLMSSVLNIQEIQEIEQKQRDIAYKTSGDLLDVFLPLYGEHLGLLNIRISHNPDLVIHTEQLSGQVQATYINTQSGSLDLQFTINPNIIAHESLFWIPFSWTQQDILIEEASLNNKALSVGKLSEIINHGK